MIGKEKDYLNYLKKVTSTATLHSEFKNVDSFFFFLNICVSHYLLFKFTLQHLWRNK